VRDGDSHVRAGARTIYCVGRIHDRQLEGLKLSVQYRCVQDRVWYTGSYERASERERERESSEMVTWI